MNILFIHRYFPTQFRHLATALAADKINRVVAISDMRGGDPLHVALPADSPIRQVSYAGDLVSGTYNVPAHLKPLTEDMCIGWAVYGTARRLANEDGFLPDLIVANSLFGEGTYLRDLFPKAKILTHLELYYRLDRGHGFDAASLDGQNGRIPLLSKNASIALAAATADWAMTSTAWERDQFPAVFHSKISVIHEGVDTERAVPGREALTIDGKGVTLSTGDEVVTYAARAFETLRGTDNFLHAIPEILRERPQAHVIMIGDAITPDENGQVRPGATDLNAILSQYGSAIDPMRVHFLGRLAHDAFLRVLRVSAVHVYLSAPFILSWSFLEAMASGCAIVASDNPPVTEVMDDDSCGQLVDFFDPGDIAQGVVELLADRQQAKTCGAAARRLVVARYDLSRVCLPRQLGLIEDLTAGKLD